MMYVLLCVQSHLTLIYLYSPNAPNPTPLNSELTNDIEIWNLTIPAYKAIFIFPMVN